MESLQVLIEQRNALREQNEKLLGSLRSQDTIIRQLTDEELKIIADRDSHKKAFEEVFEKNVGLLWEKYVEETNTPKDDLSEKITFFNKTINDSKLYVIQKAVETARQKIAAENEEREQQIKNTENIAKMAIGALLAIDKKSNKGKNFKGISTIDSALSLPFAELKDRCEALANIKLVGGSESEEPDEEKLPAFGKEGDVKGFGDILDETPSKGFNLEGSLDANESTPVEQDSTSIFTAAYADYKLRHDDCADLNDLDIKARARKSINEAFFFACVEDILKDFAKIKDASDEDKERIKRCTTVSTAVIHAIGAEGKGTYKEISEAVNDTGANETYLRKLVGVTGPLQKGGFLHSFKAESSGGSGAPGTRYELTQDGIILFDALFGVKGEQIRQPGFRYSENGDDQKSLPHKELNEKVKNILLDNGFNCTTEFSVELGRNGDKAICDILAEKNGKEYWVECERDEGSPQHYKDKVEKILRTGRANVVYFVVPNKEKKSSFEAKLLKSDLPGRSFSVTTVETIKKTEDLNKFLRVEKK